MSTTVIVLGALVVLVAVVGVVAWRRWGTRPARPAKPAHVAQPARPVGTLAGVVEPDLTAMRRRLVQDSGSHRPRAYAPHVAVSVPGMTGRRTSAADQETARLAAVRRHPSGRHQTRAAAAGFSGGWDPAHAITGDWSAPAASSSADCSPASSSGGGFDGGSCGSTS